MDKEKFEKEMKKRQEKHLKSMKQKLWRPCLHDGCSECHGTGIKKDGSPCVHFISCPCPKCTPSFMSV